MTQAYTDHAEAAPSWQLDSSGPTTRVVLGGSWHLFLAGRARERLGRELDALEHPEQLAWDLTHITGLDSAGAWLLCRLWGGQLPEQLTCRAPDRHRLERLVEAPTVPEPQRRRSRLLSGLDRLGGGLVGIARSTAGLLALLVGVLIDLGICCVHWRLIPAREISAAIYRTGVSSVLLLGVTGYVIGIVMSLQIGVTLSDFGANQRIIGLIGLAVTRELGPVIAAIIQVGRAGSAITAGIAGMHLTEELDALKTFGASPRLRLVTSRVIGMVIAMPLLVVWTDAAEILGGATTAQFDLGVPYGLFLARLPESVSMFNFWLGLIKGALFGLIIAIVGSYFGLTARANTDSLSAQTTRSVVVGLSLILIIDALTGAVLAKLGFL
ncbi:ABC transporter permease [Salinisphaera sp. SPP-AMP-43]|uniref:MlaE family ABC transporter permease n=1 Tax=Salinisphaera sp. SPP-AMP-43 TaxID=3121288 RepID=UPI003C6E8886